MVTIHNKKHCSWCGKPTNYDYREDDNGNLLWVCEEQECQKGIDRQLRDEAMKSRNRMWARLG